MARPGEGRLRVIGDDEVPAIPNVLTLALEDQPMSRLRDCLGMHDRALPGRVMKTLREHIEKRPKNVSFSEDNGYWMPGGSRLDVKVYPRDSAVSTDHRHRWSKKWTWSLWPVGNVPGTWVWMADEERVAPSAIHIWPSTARPILTVVYICPTVGYKEALHASTDHVQSGRKHLPRTTCTCQTCMRSDSSPGDTVRPDRDARWTPPRERGCMYQQSQPCPTSNSSLSVHEFNLVLLPRYMDGSEPNDSTTICSLPAVGATCSRASQRGIRDQG